MFARQIAVMKGQAWNVVETLKTGDHGPLELTRRTRVCVWDDLVDIPVAIPMRGPSAEMRRRRQAEAKRSLEQEEMDISAANASASQPTDLLNLDSPTTTELPNPNRFNLSRNNSSSDLHRLDPGIMTPATINDPLSGQARELNDSTLVDGSKNRPIPNRSKTRPSIEEGGINSGTRRRQSFSTRYGSGLFLGDGDDLEGDLGYSAAEGMESRSRKVIVERLETVKSKHPVFTWC